MIVLVKWHHIDTPLLQRMNEYRSVTEFADHCIECKDKMDEIVIESVIFGKVFNF